MEKIKLRENQMLIAVYGTLKKGFNGHELINDQIKKNKASLVGEGWWPIPYLLIDLDAYPALINATRFPLDEGATPLNNIYLEVYVIEKEFVKSLDSYEGYPYLFEKTTVDLKPFEDVTIYISGPLINTKAFIYPKIKSGCYGKEA